MSTFLAAVATLAGGWLLINVIGALLVGALAREILPGKDKVSWLQTIVIGFLGGIVGKVVAFMIGWRHLGIIGGFSVSVLGAFVLLLAHRLWRASKSAGTPTTPGA
jgi:uncharacterized membrane protein YeaQ/YmgE (transglycosylase-associated protein family)